MEKRIFTFWENKKNALSLPPYIELCMETWRNNIPGLELVVVNYDNLYDWIDEDYIKSKDLRGLLLPQQKDVIQYGLIHKHGGVFLDADTIIVKDIFDEIEKLDDKLYFFGNPKKKFVNVGAMICKKAGNEALAHCKLVSRMTIKENKRLFSRYNTIKIKGFVYRNIKVVLKAIIKNYHPSVDNGFYLPLGAFGNCIVNPVLREARFSDCTGIIERSESGTLLEWLFLKKSKKEGYLELYFGENDIELSDIVNKMKFGLVCLHNSWTPEDYKKFDYKTIKEDKSLMSRLLMYALSCR